MSEGVYCLIIEFDKDRKIKIGKLGFIDFRKGYYCYVGSALNNLEKRIERHKNKNKKLRWHIDYFLRCGKIVDIIKIKTNEKIECSISEKINKIADDKINDFGCSDCRCKSHLCYFNKKPKLIKNGYPRIKKIL